MPRRANKKDRDNDTHSFMIALTGTLLCGCSLVGDWKEELFGESKSGANTVAESREVVKEM